MVRRCKRRFSGMTAVLYFVARVCPIAYILTNVIVEADLVGGDHCRAITEFAAVVNIVTVPAISLLFLLRVIAIYLHHRIVIAFFGICWLGLLVSCVIDSATMFSNFLHLPETKNCSLTGRSTDAWAYTASAIFDTLIFLAISWRLASTSVIGSSWRDRLRSFVRGEGLLGLSKVLLRGGQSYYIMTIGLNVATAMSTFIPGVPIEWWGLLTMPNMAMQSVMACRIFRELKLEAIVDILPEDADIITSMMFASVASHATSPNADLGECLTPMVESRGSGIVGVGTGKILNESSDVC